MNGVVPATIIVAGLALAGYALLTTARDRRMSVTLLAALGVLEILLLVQVGIIMARLAGGGGADHGEDGRAGEGAADVVAGGRT